ncbi:SGNH/GDSL hydrolase family protein [Mucilaginibacter paludis]|uniref:Lipolytic protein G-D-S-L family n=1 Tax=Mucilaginibacter paludis DSM 18603 TaxID=714943 RepID=H1YDN7_9SPHI|nr:SGNH/GDSL hydrolase family protein [Mucilaginibacter paludis]EHQ30726.1 lipolytic protein G-D-S-L family [Mucilaginibacter paludis DSM 18603]
MQKNLLSVLALALLFTFAACNKTAVDPVQLPSIGGSYNTAPVVEYHNIVILGGSTAWGKGASAHQYSWVSRLEAKVKFLHKNDTIINLAFPGYTTYHILPTKSVTKTNRPEADTLRNITTALAKKPIMVIISLPSNDIANGYNDVEILNNYKTVADILHRQNIPYFITSNQPRNLSLSQRKRLKTFTNLLVKTFPGHIIDYLDQLSDSSWLFKPVYNCGDGIHPNDRGHEVIYKAFVNNLAFKKALGF